MRHWLRNRYEAEQDTVLASLTSELRERPSEQMALAVLAVALEIAAADGWASPVELSRTVEMLAEHPNLRLVPKAELEALIADWTALVAKDPGAARAHARSALLAVCADDPQAGRLLLIAGLHIAMADRAVGPTEIAAVRELGISLGMATTDIAALIRGTLGDQ